MSRRHVAAFVVGALMTSCGRPPRLPESPVSAHAPDASPVPIAQVSSAPAEVLSAGDVYLSPDRAGGSPFCFDPGSAMLRDYVKRPRRDEDTPLAAAALAADVRDLHVAMKKLYAGYPELLQSTSFDVERFFLDWERDVRAAGPSITLDEGILRPLVSLRHHIRDNHLFVSGGGGRLAHRTDLAFSEYQAQGKVEGFDAAHCAFEGGSPVTGTARVAKLLTRHGQASVTTFSAQSTAPWVDVRCGGRTTRFERRVSRAKELDDRTPAYEHRVVGDATVIIIRTFSGSPEAKATLARIEQDYDTHRKKPVIVFDFRGNGGGSDQPVFDWIEKAKRGPWSDPFVQLTVTGAARGCGEWNHLVLDQLIFGSADTAEGKAEREAFLAKTPLGDVQGAPAQVMNGASRVSHAHSPYAGRIFAIIDNATASSGETAPDGLRAALGAIVVGERGAGFLEYGNIYPYAMPRTGVVWQIASQRNYYPEPHDGVGLPVDVYLDDDLLRTPVEDLVPLLETLHSVE